MKIYLASSYKNETLVIVMASALRQAGHEVDAFCDPRTGRAVFTLSDPRFQKLKNLSGKDFCREKPIKDTFIENKKWLDWCECCILILPSGRSAHLEAGYAKGQGKKLIIYHAYEWPAGEVDIMYCFADLLTAEIDEIRRFLK